MRIYIKWFSLLINREPYNRGLGQQHSCMYANAFHRVHLVRLLLVIYILSIFKFVTLQNKIKFTAQTISTYNTTKLFEYMQTSMVNIVLLYPKI